MSDFTQNYRRNLKDRPNLNIKAFQMKQNKIILKNKFSIYFKLFYIPTFGLNVFPSTCLTDHVAIAPTSFWYVLTSKKSRMLSTLSVLLCLFPRITNLTTDIGQEYICRYLRQQLGQSYWWLAGRGTDLQDHQIPS